MILVTLGTQDKSFIRLLQEIERLIQEGIIDNQVLVQAGNTEFESEYMEIFDLIPITQFQSFIQQADLLITHGGVGSIITALKENKKVIAVARRVEYQEHTNNHQLEIIEEFSNQGYVLPVYEVQGLRAVLEKVIEFKPKRFISNTSNMVALIQNYIDEHSKKNS